MENRPGDNELAKTNEEARKNVIAPVLRKTLRLGGQNRTNTPLEELLDKSPLRIEIIQHETNGLRWINILRPGNGELAWLRQQFEINSLHLEDITSRLQRPKIDDYEDYIFLVMHFPVYNKAERETTAAEIDMFMGPDYVITVHDGKLRSLNRLFEQCKNNSGRRNGILGRTPAYALYRLVDVLVDYCFPIINKQAEKLDDLDERIFKSPSSADTIYEISVIRRDIIAIRRIIKPQIAVIASLEHRKRTADHEDMEGYWSDVKDHISKIWDSLEEFKEVVEGLSSTYDSLTSHRLNQVIKTLTIISVVVLPLTLVSGIYGMNVEVPFQHEPWTFIGIMVLLVMMAALMLLFFRWRKWL